MVVCDLAHPSIYLRVMVILSKHDAVGVVVGDHKICVSLHSIHNTLSQAPRIVLYEISSRYNSKPSKKFVLLGRRKAVRVSILSDMFPALAVVVLPDHEGKLIAGQRLVLVSVEPHPVVPKGIAVKDDIVVRERGRSYPNNDYIPSGVPLVVKGRGQLLREGIQLAFVYLSGEVGLDLIPNDCEVVVVEVACALPVEGNHWLLQEKHDCHQKTEERGSLHIKIILIVLKRVVEIVTKHVCNQSVFFEYSCVHVPPSLSQSASAHKRQINYQKRQTKYVICKVRKYEPAMRRKNKRKQGVDLLIFKFEISFSSGLTKRKSKEMTVLFHKLSVENTAQTLDIANQQVQVVKKIVGIDDTQPYMQIGRSNFLGYSPPVDAIASSNEVRASLHSIHNILSQAPKIVLKK